MISLIKITSLFFFTGVMMIFSKNPIHSILYLILNFLLTTLFFLSLNVEFLAFLFLVIYVGAIAVLFLFVVMMLNIKIAELNQKFITYIPIAILVVAVIIGEIYFILIKSHLSFSLSKDIIKFFFNFDDIFFNLKKEIMIDYNRDLNFIDNITQIGFIMYTSYSFLVIISAMILFVAMVGSIILTINVTSNEKIQDYYEQNSATVNTSLYFIK